MWILNTSPAYIYADLEAAGPAWLLASERARDSTLRTALSQQGSKPLSATLSLPLVRVLGPESALLLPSGWGRPEGWVQKRLCCPDSPRPGQLLPGTD